MILKSFVNQRLSSVFNDLTAKAIGLVGCCQSRISHTDPCSLTRFLPFRVIPSTSINIVQSLSVESGTIFNDLFIQARILSRPSNKVCV